MWLAVAQYLALLACSVFTGAAIYINVAEHPARMECGTRLAATVFGPSYRRAASMQAGLAALALVFGLWAWWLGGSVAWLIAAFLMIGIIVFTVIAIMPTNKELLDPALDRESDRARELLVRWGYLHAGRSVLSAIALMLFGADLAFV